MRRKAKKQGQAQRNEPEIKERGQHPLIFVVGLVAFCMIAYGGFLTQKLLDPAAFPIRKIAVEGEFQHLTAEHVQTVVSNAVNGGFFDVDVTKVRAHILDEPWIFDAAVRRVWPDTIRVSIREQNAVARWGEYALLNQTADIFVPNLEDIPAGLVVLNGPIGSESELLSWYIAVKNRFDAVGLGITHISLSDRRAWAIELDDGVKLVVGRHAVADRLSRFSSAFERVLKENWDRVALVDLRYTNGFAIREKASVADNG